jgi:hypothetical protein
VALRFLRPWVSVAFLCLLRPWAIVVAPRLLRPPSTRRLRLSIMIVLCLLRPWVIGTALRLLRLRLSVEFLRLLRPWVIGTALCLLRPWGGLAQDAPPSTATVLARVASYVSAYQKQLIGVVAEEHYRQNVANTSRGGRQSRQFRELRSDLLLVKLPDEDHWLQFRDVFEVDRKPVRDRDERLYKLFITPTADARAQAETIQLESSRHNIGPVHRTINMPILALLFFDESLREHIQIERLVANNSKRFEPLARAEHVWRLGFTETGTPTLVRGAGGKDIPSHGEIWVDSTTGRVLQTELVSEDGSILIATIHVTYGTAPGFTLLLPAEMRELYRVRVNESRIDGHAIYSKFRQFTVTTTEKPKGQ